jgi:hypothetical protein
MTYPDETFGEAMDRVRADIEALPWQVWPFKVYARWRLKMMEAMIVTARDEGLRRFFAS